MGAAMSGYTDIWMWCWSCAELQRRCWQVQAYYGRRWATLVQWFIAPQKSLSMEPNRDPRAEASLCDPTGLNGTKARSWIQKWSCTNRISFPRVNPQSEHGHDALSQHQYVVVQVIPSWSTQGIVGTSVGLCFKTPVERRTDCGVPCKI